MQTKIMRLLNAIDALETGLSIYVDARETLPVVSVPAAGQNAVRPSAVESANFARSRPSPIRKSGSLNESANRVGTGHKLIAYLTCGTRSDPTK